MASIHLEQYFANVLHLTSRVDDFEREKISFPLTQNAANQYATEKFYKSLHVVDPRANNRFQYVNVSDVDSSFERDFLLQLVPEKHGYLAQLLEKQRSRSSFTRDNNQGRVDFSLEIPYDISESRINKYNSQVQIKHHKTYIIEVDGKKYHTDLIDDLKDFEIAQLSRTISHITQDRVHKDVNEFIQSITSEDYVKTTAENYADETYITNPLTALVMSPFNVARLQRIFLQYLIANYETLIQQQSVKIAVVERDFPCAYAAFDDLLQLLNTLNDLAQTKIALPKIEVEIFSSNEFINHPLHGGQQVTPISSFNPTYFNLVLDASVMRREAVFNEDVQIAFNTIIIRNAALSHLVKWSKK